jgi:hypothetical protein
MAKKAKEQPTFSFVLVADDGPLLFEGTLKAVRELSNTLEGLLAEHAEHLHDPIPKLKFGDRNRQCGPFTKRVI